MSLPRGISRDEMKKKVDKLLREKHKIPTPRNIWNGFVCKDYPYQSAATPPTCPDACEECCDQYVPLPTKTFPHRFRMVMHDDNQAAASVKDLIETTNDNLTYIKNMIADYGNTIAKRWQKRNTPKRAALLRAARPNMYPRKHAEFELMYDVESYTEAKDQGRQGKMVSLEVLEEAYLIPYLDAQSLSEGTYHYYNLFL